MAQQANCSISYKQKVQEILLKVRLAFSMPEMAEEDLEVHLSTQADVFIEIIGDEIPIDMLNVSYVRAMKFRVSTFPLAPNEMVLAYRQLRDERVKPSLHKCIFCEHAKTNPDRPCKLHRFT